MNRKGLSDVITTVLIILVALVAVAIIGTLIINNLNKSSARIDTSTACQGVSTEVKPLKCTATNGVVSIQRGTDASGAVLSGFKLIYTTTAGASTPSDSTGTLAAYETKDFTPASYTSTGVASVKIAPVVKTTDGKTAACDVIPIAVDCA